MVPDAWSDAWGDYRFNFVLDGPRDDWSQRVAFAIVHTGAGQQVGEGRIKYRREGFVDPISNEWFDQVVLSVVEICQDHTGRGLGTEVVRSLARKFDRALIVGEAQNDDALRWHERVLERELPTRMIRLVDRRTEERVTPGRALDPTELQPTSTGRRT